MFQAKATIAQFFNSTAILSKAYISQNRAKATGQIK